MRPFHISPNEIKTSARHARQLIKKNLRNKRVELPRAQRTINKGTRRTGDAQNAAFTQSLMCVVECFASLSARMHLRRFSCSNYYGKKKAHTPTTTITAASAAPHMCNCIKKSNVVVRHSFSVYTYTARVHQHRRVYILSFFGQLRVELI